MFVCALQPLPAGAEVTGSYVVEAEPLPRRRARLEPHGFVCRCELCCEDEAVTVRGRDHAARCVLWCSRMC